MKAKSFEEFPSRPSYECDNKIRVRPRTNAGMGRADRTGPSPAGGCFFVAGSCGSE